jgi:uncharacterized protein
MSGHYVQVYRDSRGEWRWRRLHENGNVVADSGEGYVNYEDCFEMASLVNVGINVVQAED